MRESDESGRRFRRNDEGAPLSDRQREFARTLPSDLPAALDALDLELISQLQVDGRLPYRELARRVGASEKVVRRRITTLLEQRCITIAAVTDPRFLGFDCIAMLLITTDGTCRPEQVADALTLMPSVDYVTVTTGRFTVQAEVVCTNALELHRLASETIQTIAGVARVEVLQYLRLHYQQARFFHSPSSRRGVRPRELDATDRAIVARLAVDGRAPFRNFSVELGVSETNIRLRYARLVESGAVQVMCVVNPLRLGYTHSCWVGISVGTGGGAEQVAESLTRLESVSYVAITAGRWDVLAEVISATGEDLLTVLDTEIRTIDAVSHIECLPYVSLYYKPTPVRNPLPEYEASPFLGG